MLIYYLQNLNAQEANFHVGLLPPIGGNKPTPSKIVIFIDIEFLISLKVAQESVFFPTYHKMKILKGGLIT